MFYALLLSALTLVPTTAIEQIAVVESGKDPSAVSPAGAIGYVQVMPATARDPGFGVEPLRNPWDKEENRRFAKEYFSALLWEFGSIKHALMAYNWGPASVKRWIRRGKPSSHVPRETKRYVQLLEEPVRKAIEEDWTRRIWKDLKEGASPPILERLLFLQYIKTDRDFPEQIRANFSRERISTLLTVDTRRQMPHGKGLKLSINKESLMGARVPGGAGSGMAAAAAEGVDESAGQPQEQTQGVEQRAFKIGQREGQEARQQDDFESNPERLQDMAAGILENAGIVTSGMSQDRVSNLTESFISGWNSTSSGDGQGRDSMVDQESIFIS